MNAAKSRDSSYPESERDKVLSLADTVLYLKLTGSRIFCILLFRIYLVL